MRAFAFFTILLMTLLKGYGGSLELGRPIKAQIPGVYNWDLRELKMSIHDNANTSLECEHGFLDLYQSQRLTLVEYLHIAQKWQLTGNKPKMKAKEAFQICVGDDSIGAFGLMVCDDHVPYVVIILGDRDKSLKKGTRCFLNRNAVSEMMIQLDGASATYKALQQRTEKKQLGNDMLLGDKAVW